MRPELITITCPKCKKTSKPIPSNMGDKTIKCQCGRFVHYGWRKFSISIVKRPERVSSSGLALY